MVGLNRLKSEIEKYEKNYRNPNLPPFEYCDLYDLFPEKDNPCEVKYCWDDKFPFLDKAGVYAFLNDNLEVLYIGKASMNNTIGYRLSSYCKYGKDKECVLKDEWNGNPRYIFSVAVPSNTKFEAPALEEYLIERISTPNNKAGTNQP